MQFIDGVNFIDTIIAREASIVELIFAIVLFGGGIAAFVWSAINTIKNKKEGAGGDIALAAGFLLCLLLSINSYCTTTNQYVVQVDDGVSMNEFTENYKIVSCVNDKYIIELVNNE